MSREIQQELPPGTRIVTRPEVAALLVEAARVTYLLPFLDRTCTLSGAARELGLPMNRMHYWVKKLVGLDLIEVVEVQERAGRPILHYRSTAPAFFVPFSATPADSLESQLVEDEGARQRRLSILFARTQRERSADHGTLLRRVAEGMTRTSTHPAHVPRDVVFSTWLERPLSAQHARALRTELLSLAERYATLASDADDASPFILRLALVPSGADA